MRLIARLSDLARLKEVSSFLDAILIEDDEDIQKNITLVKSLNLLPVYNLSEMILPFMLKEYKNKIMKTKDLGCFYYITDLGLAHILKELGLIDRTIYDPITMITNHLDAKAFQEYGFAAISLSNEITLEDTKKIIASSNCKAFLQVFGFRAMLHTRRKLVSLYQQKIGASFPLTDMTIEEATRKKTFPIVETDTGTTIYRSYIICLLKELIQLNLEFAYLDSLGIQETVFFEVLRLFDALRKGQEVEEIAKALASLELPIEEGFSYRDSVYMKEEF